MKIANKTRLGWLAGSFGLLLALCLTTAPVAAQTPSVDRAALTFDDARVVVEERGDRQVARLEVAGRLAATLSAGNGLTLNSPRLPGGTLTLRTLPAAPTAEWSAFQLYLIWSDLEADRGHLGERKMEWQGGYLRVADGAGSRTGADPNARLASVDLQLGDLTLIVARDARPDLSDSRTAFSTFTARLFDVEGSRLGIARWFADPGVYAWGLYGIEGGHLSAQNLGELPVRPSMIGAGLDLYSRYQQAAAGAPECVIGPCPPWPPGGNWPPTTNCDYEEGWCPAECFSCTPPEF